ATAIATTLGVTSCMV
ncbi:MAG: smalltalk protein, partial [Prevotella sp.]